MTLGNDGNGQIMVLYKGTLDWNKYEVYLGQHLLSVLTVKFREGSSKNRTFKSDSLPGAAWIPIAIQFFSNALYLFLYDS